MISFVTTARNDNYGGNFMHRLQVFLNSLLGHWKKYDIQAELIIVEWNPPKDNQPLARALSFTGLTERNTIRIITVPNEIHRQLPNSDRTPMFEYIAKNVGIRRAKGAYILATNPDILFNDKLVRFLKSNKLSPNSFYRIDRFDVSKPIPQDLPLKKQLQFCRRYSSRINTLGITEEINFRIPLFLRELFARRAIRQHREEQLERKVRVEDILHTNASGDFLFMPRDVWFTLHGYPQLATLSHIDSFMCCMAASMGVKQIILRSAMRIYHQEHFRGESTNRPMTSYELWTQECEKMLRDRKPTIKNDENWGLGDKVLEEQLISPVLQT